MNNNNKYEWFNAKKETVDSFGQPFIKRDGCISRLYNDGFTSLWVPHDYIVITMCYPMMFGGLLATCYCLGKGILLF